jgi:hypothetical protein
VGTTGATEGAADPAAGVLTRPERPAPDSRPGPVVWRKGDLRGCDLRDLRLGIGLLARRLCGAGASGSTTGSGSASAAGSSSGATSVAGAGSASALFRATAALRSAFVYWRQWGLHMRPRPSFWLGWTGKSPGSASWPSMPKREEPTQRRIGVLVSVVMVVISIVL